MMGQAKCGRRKDVERGWRGGGCWGVDSGKGAGCARRGDALEGGVASQCSTRTDERKTRAQGA